MKKTKAVDNCMKIHYTPIFIISHKPFLRNLNFRFLNGCNLSFYIEGKKLKVKKSIYTG